MSAAHTAVSAADRLGLALFLAAAAHGLVILGVGFAPLESGPEPPQALDVVLLQTHTDEAPDEADFLSDVSADGGGSVEEPERPRSPVTSPEPEAQAGLSPIPLEAGAPDIQVHTPEPVLTRRLAEDAALSDYRPREQHEDLPRVRPDTVDYDARVAALTAEIDRSLSDYAQRPRKAFVTARTRESVAAAYMSEWVESVERMGNLNYPEAARRNRLSGALILVVGIRPDGNLHEVRVRASSGQSVLDEAAERIVRQAAPYKPFPDELRERTDILYITRTWEFLSSNELTTR